jgi:hypothetical protein
MLLRLNSCFILIQTIKKIDVKVPSLTIIILLVLNIITSLVGFNIGLLQIDEIGLGETSNCALLLLVLLFINLLFGVVGLDVAASDIADKLLLLLVLIGSGSGLINETFNL